MIYSKTDLRNYIYQDRIMKGISTHDSFISAFMRLLAPAYSIRYLYYLRKEEYYTNTRSILRYYYQYKKRKLGIKLGYSIPANVFGPGLSLPHYGTIVVSKHAKIGCNCRLHVSTNIGASAGNKDAPVIGDNVYIGPGAILFGKIKIANNITIGANATVNKNFDISNVVIAGSPAKVVKENYDNWVNFNKVRISLD